jgi:outer membrane receptor protein involved in Fe transport
MLDVEPNVGASAGLFGAPGFVTTDLGAAVSLGGGLELFGRVTNVFDRAYEETLGFPAPGRTGVMGLRVAGGR